MRRLGHSPRGSTIPQPGERRVTPGQAVLAGIVIVAVIAMAIWFLFLSSGGIGPGTV